MAREMQGLAAGLIAGLAAVGLAYGVSAVGTHIVPADTKQQEAQQGAPATQTLPGGGQTASSQLVATGRTLYTAACAGCHGAQAQGQVGPTLHKLGDPDAKIARNIRNGFPPRMPAFNKYSDVQMKALVAYIQSLK